MFSVVLVLNCIQAVHKIVKMNHFIYLTHESVHINVCIYAYFNFGWLTFIIYFCNVNMLQSALSAKPVLLCVNFGVIVVSGSHL